MKRVSYGLLIFSLILFLVCHFYFGIEVIGITVQAMVDVVISTAILIWMFLKKTCVKTVYSLFSKRILRPLYAFLGISWIIRHISKFCKHHITPKCKRCLDQGKMRWANLSAMTRAIVMGGVVAFVCACGLGLWLIPISLSFYIHIVSRAQTAWLDFMIRRHSKRHATALRKRIRRHKNHRAISPVRYIRFRVLQRDRRMAAWLRQKLNARQNDGVVHQPLP